MLHPALLKFCDDNGDWQMNRSEAVKKITNALIGAEQQALHRLVKRLGIQPEIDAMSERLGFKKKGPDWIAWMLVGRILAKEQPEFKRRSKRGRPRKRQSDAERLSLAVDKVKADFPAMTDKEILSLAKERFPSTSSAGRIVAAELTSLRLKVSVIKSFGTDGRLI